MAVARSEERVTNLELFFDLVFVFAITQVTALMSHEPTWAGLGKGVLMLSALWLAWASFAWLTNTIDPEEGGVRLAIFATMAALLIASLAVPEAFHDDAVIFGVAYFVVRAMHIALYALAARSDPTLRTVVTHLWPAMLGGAALIVVAGLVHGTARYVLWTLAVTIQIVGPFVGGVAGWRLHPGHFAERHGAFIIIALGESIVAAGVGVSGQELDAALVTAALLTISVAAALWWAYFDVVALVAERKLRAAEGDVRARMARDSYTFIHLPMVLGIVLFALGTKKTLAHLHEPLDVVPAVALLGGLALYLFALSALKRRNIGTFNYQRLVAAAALVALIPVAHQVDALVALAGAAALACGLIAYEATRYRLTRDRIRHTDEIMTA
jgi:low temperature requirement protein LtrA